MKYFVDVNSFAVTRIEERELKSLVDGEIMVSMGDVKSVLEIKVYTR